MLQAWVGGMRAHRSERAPIDLSCTDNVIHDRKMLAGGMLAGVLSMAPHRGGLALQRGGSGGMQAARLSSSRIVMGVNAGDVATVSYKLRPDLTTGRAASFGAGAEQIVSSLPFDVGDVTFVVGGGGYLPGLHEALVGMEVGAAKAVTVDAGYGEYIEEGKIVVPIEQAPQGLKAGMVVSLTTPNGQVQATVTEMNSKTCTIDTNHPLAGVKLQLDVQLKAIGESSDYQVATVAGGCFWGLELAYQREPGVVGTAVGYTQGDVDEPSYEQVCSGTTGHTEAVQVVFDPKAVTYKRLCEVLVERLGDSIYLLNQVGNDRGTQYRHGIYPHNPDQEAIAKEVLEAVGEHKSLGPVQTEIVSAAQFWKGEDYHQQYLQKGGQSAKKEAPEEIRCYG